MLEEKVLIRKAEIKDFDSIYFLYSNYMFDSYLLRFDSNFVKKYLKAIIKSENCITLVAEKNDIVGFIMALYRSKRFALEFLLKLFSSLYFLEVIKHPAIIFLYLELLTYFFKTRIKDTDSELLFISIEPSERRKGLAKMLIRKTLSLLFEKEVKKVKVTTKVENYPVNRLLVKLGFKREKVFYFLKDKMYLYSYEI
jgi:ribosomal protein S18 acetylase RimI-like enzyme